MSSVREQFHYQNQEKVYSRSNPSWKKPDIFELIQNSNEEKKRKNKFILKYTSIFTSIAASIVLFYSFY